MEKNQTLALAACCVLGIGAVGFGVHRHQVGVARAEAVKKADNLYSAKKCITGHSPLPEKAKAAFRDCELVELDLLPEESKADFSKALAKNDAFKAELAAKLEAVQKTVNGMQLNEHIANIRRWRADAFPQQHHNHSMMNPSERPVSQRFLSPMTQTQRTHQFV